MSTQSRDLILSLAAVAALIAIAVGGWWVVRARAEGGGAVQAPAQVDVPAPAASGSSSEAPDAEAPEESAPSYETWQVGKAVGEVVVREKPSDAARVKVRLDRRNYYDYPTIVLVDEARVVKGDTWHRVWLSIRPNGSRGWVKEGQLAFYTTSAKIEIDLSERTLHVYRRGELRGSYPVAVGRPSLSTPTGFFFVNQKLKPADPEGVYGELAIGLSAFQPKLSDWPYGGPVAIHGTNQPSLIGQAVSHGCVRMRNNDVREVGRLVPAGSPVVIVE
jgi:lipoprotein-anchoring transpeptidase ErfK/SrfK